MGLTECPHCNGSLDVKQCDNCSEFVPTDEIYTDPNGEDLCNSCQMAYAEVDY